MRIIFAISFFLPVPLTDFRFEKAHDIQIHLFLWVVNAPESRSRFDRFLMTCNLWTVFLVFLWLTYFFWLHMTSTPFEIWKLHAVFYLYDFTKRKLLKCTQKWFFFLFDFTCFYIKDETIMVKLYKLDTFPILFYLFVLFVRNPPMTSLHDFKPYDFDTDSTLAA